MKKNAILLLVVFLAIANLLFSDCYANKGEFSNSELEAEFCNEFREFGANVDLALTDYESIDCSFSNLEAEPVNCSEDHFYLRVSFDFEDPNTQSFQIIVTNEISGESELFEFPYTTIEGAIVIAGYHSAVVGPFALDSTITYEIEVRDPNLDNYCGSTIEIDSIVGCMEPIICFMDAELIEMVEHGDSITYTIAVTAEEPFSDSFVALDYNEALLEIEDTIGIFSLDESPITFTLPCFDYFFQLLLFVDLEANSNSCQVGLTLYPDCLTMGIEAIQGSDLSVNFINNEWTIEGVEEDEKIGSIFVLNQTGQIVKNTFSQKKINALGLPVGVYFIHIQTNQQEFIYKTFKSTH